MKFINEVAEHIYLEYNGKYDKICIVVPNKRAGLFLKKALTEKHSNEIIFIPTIYSIEEYIYAMSGLASAEEISLISMLYKSYSEILGNEAYEFDKFYSTGKVIISDFNDIDDNLKDAENVFTNVYSAKKIEIWSPENAKTNRETKYLKFYKLLKDIHSDFTKQLLNNSLAYRGLAAKKLAESGSNNIAFKFEKIIFAGMNAISPSFEKHIDKLMECDKADLIWDADPLYLNDNYGKLEAGKFLKKSKLKWEKTFKNFENNTSLFDNPKEIKFIGSPFRLTQIMVGLNLLTEKIKNNETDTLLVLADEKMLPLLINCLPKDIVDNVNISMGMPISETLCGQLIKSIINMHTNPFLNNNQISTFYYNDVIQVISNPLLSILVDDKNIDNFNILKKEILSAKRKVIKIDDNTTDKNDFNTKFTELSKLLLQYDIFGNWTNWKTMIKNCNEICNSIFKNIVKKPKLFIEKETSWKISQSLIAIENSFINIENNINFGTTSISDFIVRYINSARIPLKGEPLKGIQILGLLETRAIDFKNIIIVGVNEGFLPANSKKDTLIPFDFRINLGLPLPADTEAIFDYHFYRLIQHAENITLIYNTENDTLSGKEPSRYLSQLKYHIAREHKSIKIEEKIISINYSDPIIENFTLPDSKILREKLLNYLENKGLSFSALHNFMSCPYKFALNNLLKIRDEQIDSLQIKQNVLGDIFHESIETIFENYKNKNITEADRSSIINSIEDIFFDKVKSNNINDYNNGYKYLQLDVLKDSLIRYTKNYINKAIKDNIIILDSEKKYEYEISVADKKIKICGTIDRIESIGKYISICDFKTTRNDPNLNYKIDETINIDNMKYLIQLMFYSLIYVKSKKITEKILAGNYIIHKKNNAELFYITKDKERLEIDNETLDKFETFIIEYIKQLIDEKQEYKQTPTKEACKYCSYKDHLCHENNIDRK